MSTAWPAARAVAAAPNVYGANGAAPAGSSPNVIGDTRGVMSYLFSPRPRPGRTTEGKKLAELVYLSSEDFPRLRAGGRLMWLGPHGSRPNYHDPDADTETFALGLDEDDGIETVSDMSRWASPMPAGVYIRSVMYIAEDWPMRSMTLGGTCTDCGLSSPDGKENTMPHKWDEWPQERRGRLGRRVKALRRGLGWSQRHLAGLVGVSQALINQIENGYKEPGWFTAWALAEALGVNVGEFCREG